MAGGLDERGRSMPWSALPRMIVRAPPRVVLVVGLAVVILGLLIVTRPLTSLLLLGVYVGLSAIISGIFDLIATHRRPRWWTRVFAVLWMVGGAAVLIWLGRSLELLPAALAVLLLVGGLASLGDAVVRGRASERVLAAAWGGAQVVFGILALTWPDVSVLVVAVVFGIRTIVSGIALLVQAVQGLLAQDAAHTAAQAATDEADGRVPAVEAVPDPARVARTHARRRRSADAGRYALSLVLVVAAAGGWALNDYLEDGAPVVDAFYNPPSSVPAEHGKLIRSDDYPGRAPKDGRVHRILYTTEDALGRPAVASALVITPTEPIEGASPVVIWNHGTTGVAQGCAPSLRDASATKWAIPALDDAMARGWVVVASDYSGQGAPGDYPYLIGLGEARSSLDAVLAAREFEARSTSQWVEMSARTVVWGHSQGGHAGLWTSQIAGEYAPMLSVVGTVAIAPVADPYALAKEMLRGSAGAELSVLSSWVLVPYADTYADVKVNDYVPPEARTLVREMTQRCLSEPGVVVSMVSALGVSEDRPLFSVGLIGGPLGKRLQENAVKGPLPGPLLVAWGTDDEVVPPKLQEEFVAAQCAAGEEVEAIPIKGYTHLQTILPKSSLLPELISWTDARFEGEEPAPSDCP
ncbi:lipase family protein [Microbacterium sp. P01]|uniref:lipase family protein n=1 Tax=Microbacterium sp. P01 TaxID=3366261 RepID=UPI003672D7D4